MPSDAHYTLTAFADEIAPDLATQTRVLREHGIQGLDLRSVEGTNVLQLSDAQVDAVGEACAKEGLFVSCIGSPVNKVPYSPENEVAEGQKLARAIAVAKRLGVQKIRVFTPEAPDEMGDAVMGWMEAHLRMAQEADVRLLVENDAKYWSAYPANAKRLFRELGGDHLLAAYDFANAHLLGYDVEHWFPWIVSYLDTLHIKDAKDGKVVPAGQGNAGIGVTLKALLEDGWHGPLTLEPHLAAAGPFGGFSGEQLFAEAVNALKTVFAEIGE